ncbi:MAG: hypothetical protein MUP90_07085 [Gammaproteobacteria bacterium]|nr:hypothetical protein [Gammaproteobacteria bacterium]
MGVQIAGESKQRSAIVDIEVKTMESTMKKFLLSLLSTIVWTTCSHAETGMRGDPEAPADAVAMVETMGGISVWSQMKSIHFVHEWYPWNRADSYVENATINLTGPRSYADRKSEINHSIRAYSPEGKRWDLKNSELVFANETALAPAAMGRKPPPGRAREGPGQSPVSARSSRLATLVPGRSPPIFPRRYQLIDELATCQEMSRCFFGEDHVSLNSSGRQSESMQASGTNLLEPA